MENEDSKNNHGKNFQIMNKFSAFLNSKRNTKNVKSIQKIEKKKKLKLKKHSKILIGVLGTILTIYIAGVITFSHLLMPNTSLNGYDISMKTSDSAVSYVEKSLNSQKKEIVFPDKTTETVDLSSISGTVNKDKLNKVVNAMKQEQNCFLWIKYLFDKTTYKDELIIADKDGVSEIAENFSFNKERSTESKNAYIKYDETQKEYIIVKEEIGTQLDGEKTAELIINSFKKNSNNTIYIDDSNVYKQPEITSESESITEGLALANKMNSLYIQYSMNDKSITLDGQTICTWLSWDENGIPSIDEDKLAENAKTYALKTLSKEYDEVGQTRTFKSATGVNKTVSGGTLGIEVDSEKEYKEIVNIIKEGKSVDNRTPVTKGYQADTNGGVGDTFVEVDLTNQMVYFVKDGEVAMSSPCVSGLASDPDRKTPAGCYYIYFMQKDRILRGTKLPDGTYPYESHVDYWMAFNAGIGLHDADWRSSFGGSIYKTNGSHGCVNLPTSFAKKLYSELKVGIPVICYY